MGGHPPLDALAAQLFEAFARTEYALKAGGYTTRQDGPAEADWTRFAKEGAFEALAANPQEPALRESIAFILGAPPKKQVVAGGVLQWNGSEPQNKSQAEKLLIYVRRVRNNLFHGGKFNGHWFEPERSEPLLRHSLTILRAVVDAVPTVHSAFHG